MENNKIIKILRNRFYDIKKRCNNINAQNYYLYWWRWIICEWNNSNDFINDMIKWFSVELQIDRIDVNWNYCKENCRWVTNKENCNNRRNNIFMEFNWQIKTIKQWAEEYNMPYKRVYYRMKRFWYSLEKALTIPIKEKFTNNRYKIWII